MHIPSAHSWLQVGQRAKSFNGENKIMTKKETHLLSTANGTYIINSIDFKAMIDGNGLLTLRDPLTFKTISIDIEEVLALHREWQKN